MSKKNTYIVAVDGSEFGVRAAQKAVTIAEKTGAKVVLVSVIPWSGFTPLTVEQIASRPLDKSDEENHVKNDVFAPIVAEHEGKGVDIEAVLAWGHAVDEIHNLVKERKASMIFMGRRGRSRVADLVLGSVANAVAHKAGVPICLVP